MNGLRFYQEFENKSKTKPTGNVVAVGGSNGNGNYEAIGGLYDHRNSAVATTSVSRDYLREKCKRISEAKARTIHPQLFERLDM